MTAFLHTHLVKIKSSLQKKKSAGWFSPYQFTKRNTTRAIEILRLDDSAGVFFIGVTYRDSAKNASDDLYTEHGRVFYECATQKNFSPRSCVAERIKLRQIYISDVITFLRHRCHGAIRKITWIMTLIVRKQFRFRKDVAWYYSFDMKRYANYSS